MSDAKSRKKESKEFQDELEKSRKFLDDYIDKRAMSDLSFGKAMIKNKSGKPKKVAPNFKTSKS